LCAGWRGSAPTFFFPRFHFSFTLAANGKEKKNERVLPGGGKFHESDLWRWVFLGCRDELSAA
jgi:hypothetical protein